MGYVEPPNGDEYKGQWKEDKMDGQGRIAYSDGLIHKYKGEFKGKRIHGWGVLGRTNGLKHKGQLENELRHGFGTSFW